MGIKRQGVNQYIPACADQVEKLCKLNATDREIADFFDITIGALSSWKLKYPEFLQGYRKGKLLADASVADALFRRATGASHEATKVMQYEGQPVVVKYTQHYAPDTSACIYWLKSRRKDQSGAEGVEDETTGLPSQKFTYTVVDGTQAEDFKVESE